MLTTFVDFIDLITVVTKEYGLHAGISVAIFIIAHKKYNIKELFNKEDGKGEGRKDDKVAKTIQNALHSILFKMGADRAFLFEFRDYDKRIRPIPFSYTDNTVEILNPSSTVRSEKEALQSIPLSTIPFWVKELSESRQVCLPDIQVIRHQDPATFQILERQCVKSVYAVMLLDFCGCPLGFVGVDYCEVITELEEFYIERLRAESLKIAGLLTLKKKMGEK